MHLVKEIGGGGGSAVAQIVRSATNWYVITQIDGRTQIIDLFETAYDITYRTHVSIRTHVFDLMLFVARILISIRVYTFLLTISTQSNVKTGYGNVFRVIRRAHPCKVVFVS